MSLKNEPSSEPLQVAIEDTSPMNLCVRKEAHDFIGGFPDGELFHMDMEVSVYLSIYINIYLYMHIHIHVRRGGLAEKQRMP